MARLRHSIFFTRQGDLDLGWLLLAAAFVNGLIAFDMEGAGLWKITTAAWAWYGSLTSMCFIAGAALGRARLIAGSRVPGEVAQGIAQGMEREYGTSTELFESDGR